MFAHLLTRHDMTPLQYYQLVFIPVVNEKLILLRYHSRNHKLKYQNLIKDLEYFKRSSW